MFASLRALLSGIIDYAGLFPPAKLPLKQALLNYGHYFGSPDEWMLGSFVCPADQLSKLAVLAGDLAPSGRPINISGVVKTDNYVGLLAVLMLVQLTESTYPERIRVNACETRMPNEFFEKPELVRNTRLLTAAVVGSTSRPMRRTYLEFALESEWRATVLGAAKGIAELPKRIGILDGKTCPLGFKLRCGGLEASAFPTPEQVAFIITTCRDAGVPLKFTAGLHHPIRHYDAGLQTRTHGFLNVFGAGVLAHARGLTEDEVGRIIEDEDPRCFAFDDQGFRWKDLGATTEEIAAARQNAVISFGSCSFDEPRDDLRALGLLR
jgi:hypothetical protein